MGATPLSLALSCLAGVALDALLGEPQRAHPLVAFGRLADRLERHFNGPEARGWRSHGVTAWCLAVLPLTGLAWLLSLLPGIGWLVEIVLLYLALGLRSLGEHLLPVARALRLGDLPEARRRVGFIVSRDTSALDETGVARAAPPPGRPWRGGGEPCPEAKPMAFRAVAACEENGSDAVFATLFWFAVAGAPGVVLYRLSNTLDAMWGYRNERFERFGWAAARIDDALNYLPARLAALTYALLGQTRRALRCWRAQAPSWDSPNAGPVMAAGAGALGVALGGPAIYHGELHTRPPLGEGEPSRAGDVERALDLVWAGVGVWLGVLLIGGWLHA